LQFLLYIVEIAISESVKLGRIVIPIQARAIYNLHMGDVSSDNVARHKFGC